MVTQYERLAAGQSKPKAEIERYQGTVSKIQKEEEEREIAPEREEVE